MGADFPFQVNHRTDYHAQQGGYYYAAHVAGQVNAEHGDKATHIT